jgi:class 3 adenylate cyclase
MRRPDVSYARAPDGAYLAYQSVGSGPVEMFVQFDTLAPVDQIWDSAPECAWFEGLAQFGRVTIHDKRGLGLSSRDLPPGNLETQVEDVLTVLDALGVERVVLGGLLESGAPNMLLAATHPDRVEAVFWEDPQPRTAQAADFPWGADEEYQARDRAMTASWGTWHWMNEFAALNSEAMSGIWTSDDRLRWFVGAARRTCTPDVAQLVADIWYETDVRAVLPSIQARALLLAHSTPSGLAIAGSMAAVMPHAEVVALPPYDASFEDIALAVDHIRRFVGGARPVVGMDTVLASVLFTDIVDSTRLQARLGDHAWGELVRQHNSIVRDALSRWRGRENDTAGDGFYATFDGPARAVRCALDVVGRVRDLGIDVRAGVHTGECELVDGKHAGIAVTTGARISAAAGPGQVLISQTVKDLVAGSGLSFRSEGVHDLKGVPDRIELYEAVG